MVRNSRQCRCISPAVETRRAGSCNAAHAQCRPAVRLGFEDGNRRLAGATRANGAGGRGMDRSPPGRSIRAGRSRGRQHTGRGDIARSGRHHGRTRRAPVLATASVSARGSGGGRPVVPAGSPVESTGCGGIRERERGRSATGIPSAQLQGSIAQPRADLRPDPVSCTVWVPRNSGCPGWN